MLSDSRVVNNRCFMMDSCSMVHRGSVVDDWSLVVRGSVMDDWSLVVRYSGVMDNGSFVVHRGGVMSRIVLAHGIFVELSLVLNVVCDGSLVLQTNVRVLFVITMMIKHCLRMLTDMRVLGMMLSRSFVNCLMGQSPGGLVLDDRDRHVTVSSLVNRREMRILVVSNNRRMMSQNFGVVQSWLDMGRCMMLNWGLVRISMMSFSICVVGNRLVVRVMNGLNMLLNSWVNN